jgi:hypothetical protein
LPLVRRISSGLVVLDLRSRSIKLGRYQRIWVWVTGVRFEVNNYWRG